MSESAVKWACEYCTYENWPSAIKCTMCRAQRPGGPIITEEPYKISPALDAGHSPAWDPPALVGVGSTTTGTTQGGGGSSLLICPDSSARPRVRLADEAPESITKWSCHMCTYLNWPRAIRCTQCLSNRHQQQQQQQQGGAQSPPPPPPPAPRARSPGETPQTSSTPGVPPQQQPLQQRISPVPSAIATTTTAPTTTTTPQQPPQTPDPCEERNDRNRINATQHHHHHPPGGTGQHWPCAACTYENWPKSRRCAMCDHPRPNHLTPPSGGSPEPSEPGSGGVGVGTTGIGGTAGTPLSALSPPPLTTSSPTVNEQDRRALADRWRRGCSGSGSGGTRRASPPSSGRTPEPELRTMEFQRIELAAGGVGVGSEEQEVDFKKLKQIRNRMRRTDWLFLNACAGVVEGDLAAVEAYKSSGGDIARQLTADEVRLLNRSSAFDAGFTLVHLAIRFQRQDMLAVLLTEVSQQAVKCIPAMVCPELTEQIRREVAASLHQRKGDFSCYFLTDLITFTLPADIEDLPPTIQEKLFDEVLDRDVQRELEEESPIINWSIELGTRLDSRLYALWNRTAGDCLLDSVLQATWGIYDKDSVLRKTLHDSLHDCSHWFYTRWKEWESWYSQSFGLHFSLREEQWQEDWAFILSLASQPGASLEQTHIFVLAHILRRPIIVYGVKYYKSFRGETLGYTRFQGVYLPLLWEQGFCWKSPIALGYTRGHFSALVAMENDGYDNRGAGANLNTDDDVTVTFLPLVDSERKLLHIHFLSAQEMGNEEQQERLLREWLDCCVTEGGVLVALQKSSRRRNHPLVTQMLEKWLDGYRQLRPCPTLSDGEDEDDDDDE
ncbi:LOW QUALITY PROTEIN: ubiquitin thioesterase ZRANB1-like [Alosa alosa]|uniref:LOW QUALITY PROTEIN: ubiquitin thioesterase ZRANB1-like n=1 Tax=Alosa alosa TaxID=278164 RepID=UPI0020152DF7|nr:LOW QUALITY PROTEIN: ubiquitin thioesterase ZRANB1-like [Alosa alosa]